MPAIASLEDLKAAQCLRPWGPSEEGDPLAIC